MFWHRRRSDGEARLPPFILRAGRSFLSRQGTRLLLWRWSNADIILASAGINCLSLAFPLAILQIYDRIVPNAAHATLAALVTGVGIALLLEAVLTLARARLTARAGARFEHALGCAAAHRLLNADFAAFQRVGAGVHLDRLEALTQIRDFYAGQAALAVADLPFIAIFLGLIWWLAADLVWLPVAMIAAFAAAALLLGHVLRRRLEAVGSEDGRRYNFIVEVLQGLHSVKGLGLEQFMLRRYERLIEGCAGREYRVHALSGEAANLAITVAQFATVGIAAYGSTLVMANTLTIGGLAACTMLAGRALQPVQRSLAIWARVQSIHVAKRRMLELLALPPERPPALPPCIPGPGAIRLAGLGFRHGDREPEVLRGIDLSIAPGTTVGITGAAGGGKTTLLWLIMGLIRPTAGQVTIDGQDPRQVDPETLRDVIAYVPQQAVLFEGTILENITMFRGGPMPDRARAAARRLGLDEIVGRLPQGYDTALGHSAIEALPHGFAQRIAIARALVDEPRILLLDAVDAALDSNGDAVLRRMIEEMRGRRTLVMVSRRPSLLRLADRVYELRDGRLAPAAPSAPSAAPPPAPAARGEAEPWLDPVQA